MYWRGGEETEREKRFLSLGAVGGQIWMQLSVHEGSSGAGEPRLIECKSKRVWTLFSGQHGATEGPVIIIVMHWVN